MQCEEVDSKSLRTLTYIMCGVAPLGVHIWCRADLLGLKPKARSRSSLGVQLFCFFLGGGVKTVSHQQNHKPNDTPSSEEILIYFRVFPVISVTTNWYHPRHNSSTLNLSCDDVNKTSQKFTLGSTGCCTDTRTGNRFLAPFVYHSSLSKVTALLIMSPPTKKLAALPVVLLYRTIISISYCSIILILIVYRTSTCS